MEKEKKLKPFEVRWYCKKQLRSFYDQKEKAFDTCIESIKDLLGQKLGRDYSPRQVLILLKICGPPPGYYITPETQDAIDRL